VGGQHDRVALGASSRSTVDQAPLGGVVQPAGRLVQQHSRRPRGEHDREHQPEPLPLREVPRVGVRREARDQPVEQRAGQVPAGGAAVAVGGAHSAATVSA
jgi:hypothetical protein